MDIYLVRHGQSQANAGLTGELDSHLTDLGQRQAERTAERLQAEGLTKAYVSPFRRTLQTIAPTCRLTGLRAEVYADLCEYFSAHYEGYRTFQGMAPEAIGAEFPFAFFGQTFPCEAIWWPQEFEDPKIIAARAARVRDALLRLYAATPERLLIVSHAETVGRLLEAFLHRPPDPWEPPWTDNCGISRLTADPDPARPATLVYENDTSHLEGLRA